MNIRSIALIYILCFAGLFTGIVSADDKDDAEVMKKLEANFSTIKTVQADFVEKRELKILKQTLTLKGSLKLEVPSRLIWRNDEPLKYEMMMDEKQAKQWDEDSGKVQTFDIGKDPIFKQVFGQIKAWFSGQFGALKKDYDLTVKQVDPMILSFTPRDGSLAGKAVEHVTVRIQKDAKYVDQISIDYLSGDRTTITFSNTVLNKPIPASVWKEFGRGK